MEIEQRNWEMVTKAIYKNELIDRYRLTYCWFYTIDFSTSSDPCIYTIKQTYSRTYLHVNGTQHLLQRLRSMSTGSGSQGRLGHQLHVDELKVADASVSAPSPQPAGVHRQHLYQVSFLQQVVVAINQLPFHSRLLCSFYVLYALLHVILCSFINY